MLGVISVVYRDFSTRVQVLVVSYLSKLDRQIGYHEVVSGYRCDHGTADAKRITEKMRTFEAEWWALHHVYLHGGEIIIGELNNKINSHWEIFRMGGIIKPAEYYGVDVLLFRMLIIHE